ncbi:ATP-binding protein [Corallococcus aberystwythensis]|uniref:ATP-binding protein n=1 Tax=Corallococcus aberystwythensis TaxID=2316722 RepID=A0A3A8QR84_9BACT|nr:ATP-binding protein [Corallococcus aberystwythensis]RKH69410.1 ATP-binding protein [Corallococcus aberystwythensis]
MSEELRANAAALEAELDWLQRVVDARIRLHCGQECLVDSPAALPPPDPRTPGSAYARLLQEHRLTPSERILVALALAPHVRPQALDVFLSRNAVLERPFTEFGGVVAPHGGFLPTAETALFLLAGDALHARLVASTLLDSGHPLFQSHLLRLEPQPGSDTLGSARLAASVELVDRLTLGRARRPSFGPAFPARRLTCELTWDELVLEPYVLNQVAEVRAWMDSGHTLLHAWGLGRKLGPGYRCLFHGPPGTGKTLTAALLGRQARRDVFRVDLSLVVSKYIGETEKNLESVFQHAEKQECILFFDEADALFGKRTGLSSAHDRYANQEVAYLLQRLEAFEGLVILASNLKANLDDAFLRRFQSVVHFPMPKPAERQRLWRNAFSPVCTLEPGLNLHEVAERYELAGGSILNVVRYCSLMALQRQSREILLADLHEGVRREYQKEGKTL